MARDREAQRLARVERKFCRAAEAHREGVHAIVDHVAQISAADDYRLDVELTLEERLFAAAWMGFWLGRTGSMDGVAGADEIAARLARGESSTTSTRRDDI